MRFQAQWVFSRWAQLRWIPSLNRVLILVWKTNVETPVILTWWYSNEANVSVIDWRLRITYSNWHPYFVACYSQLHCRISQESIWNSRKKVEQLEVTQHNIGVRYRKHCNRSEIFYLADWHIWFNTTWYLIRPFIAHRKDDSSVHKAHVCNF